MELVLASNNRHKMTEVRRILGARELTIRTPAELGVTFSYDETGSSYDQNALGKARHLFSLVQRPIIADDSGLAVAALNGAPGVRSARFGPPGAVLDDSGRTAYLLSLLEGETQRDAAFVCCVAVILDQHRMVMVQESVAGQITVEARGAAGFGYDPVFLVPELGRTMAELQPEEKDAVSHRGRALRRCRTLLRWRE